MPISSYFNVEMVEWYLIQATSKRGGGGWLGARRRLMYFNFAICPKYFDQDCREGSSIVS